MSNARRDTLVAEPKGQSPMSSGVVRLKRSGHVATVTIDRSGTRNACSMDMWLQIRDHFRTIAASDARVAVLTGANADFCSGADVVASSGRSTGQVSHLTALRLLAESAGAVHDCPIPVVAKIDGFAVGAGLSLALATDLIWCSDRAKLALVFAKRGLSLDYGSSWNLLRRMSIGQAKRLAFTGETVTAVRARELGLVDEVVAADELDAAVEALTTSIAAGPPIALSMTKRLLDNAANATLSQALEGEALAGIVNLGTRDLREGFLAFRERRPPIFEGR